MFATPQKKVWSGWSLTPRSGAQKVGVGSCPNSDSGADGKGKSLVVTPNSGLVAGNGGNNVLVEAGGDTESLAENFSRLENEVCGLYLVYGA